MGLNKQQLQQQHHLQQQQLQQQQQKELIKSSEARKKAIERLKEKRNEIKNKEKLNLEELKNNNEEERKKWKSKLKNNRELQVKEVVERTRIINAINEYPHIFGKNGSRSLQNEWSEMLPLSSSSLLSSTTLSLQQDISQNNNELDLREGSNPISTSLIVRNNNNNNNNNYNDDDNIRGSQDSISIGPTISTPIISRSRISSSSHPMPVTSAFLRRTVSASTPATHNNNNLNSNFYNSNSNNNSNKQNQDGLLSRFIRPRGYTIDVLPGPDGNLSPIHSNSKHGHGSHSTNPSGPTKLIDCLFLIGPTKEEIDLAVEQIMKEINLSENDSPQINPTRSSQLTIDIPSHTYSTLSSLNYSSSPNGINSINTNIKKNYFLQPIILFISTIDPELELETLGYFAFPKGVETSLSASLPNSSSNMLNTPKSPNNQRRPSFPKKTTSPGPQSQSNGFFSDQSTDSNDYINNNNNNNNNNNKNNNSNNLNVLNSDKLIVTNCLCSSSSSSSFIKFIYLLSSHFSNQFGICLTIPVILTCAYKGYIFTIKTRYCLTLLTQFPYFRFFFHILSEFISGNGLFTSKTQIISKQLSGDPIQSDLRQLENFASKLIRTILPKPGKVLNLHFTINLVHHEYSLKRLSLSSLEQEISTNTLLWSLPILLKYIPLDQLLLIIGCALTEMKIIFRCSNLEILSACVMGCLSLLSPISWVGPVITILPASMHDFIDSPTPIFLGVESTPTNFKMTNGLIIVDPIQKLIHMHPTDVVSSHTLCLPYASKLQASMKPIVENILKLSRKVKTKKRNSNTNPTTSNNNSNNNSINENSQSGNNDGINQSLKVGDEIESISDTISEPDLYSSSSSLNNNRSITNNTNNSLLLSSSSSSSLNTPNYRNSFGGTSQQRGMTPRNSTGRIPTSSNSSSLLTTNSFGPSTFSSNSRSMSETIQTQPLYPTSSTNSLNSNNNNTTNITTTNNNNTDNNTIINSSTPTPFDDFTNSSPLLTTAVMTFTDMMRDHIQKLINTTIQIQEEKQSIKLQSRINLKNTPKEISITRTISDGSIESTSDGSNLNFSLIHSQPSNLPSTANLGHDFTSTTNVFPRLSLGNSASTFIQMFQSTQMFAEYLEKTRKIHEEDLPLSSPNTPNEKKDENSDIITDVDEDSCKETKQIENDRITNDPLILLFNVMISGTYPLENKELKKLEDMYLSLYPMDITSKLFSKDINEQQQFENEEGKKSTSTKLKNLTNMNIEPIKFIDIFESIDSKYYYKSCHDVPLANNVELSIENDLWCNGRCGGLANTESCTNICLQVWEQKMLHLRKQTSALESVKNNRTILFTQPSIVTDSKIRSHNLVMPSSIKLPSGEVIPLNSICPPIPKKHNRETTSQYQYRLSKVIGQTPENLHDNYSITNSNSTINSTSSLHNNHNEYNNNYNTNNNSKHINNKHNDKHKQHHNQSQQSKYTAMRLIVRYKHKKYVKSCLNKILRVIYHYVLRKRFKKCTYFATIIQKYIRRYIVLKNMETLIINLLERKAACTKLKAQVGLTKLDLIKEIDTRNKNKPPSSNPPKVEIDHPRTLVKDLSRKNIERQHSNESTTSNSSTSVLKLFKQVSGCQDDPLKLTVHNLSKMSSKRLINGIVSSPTVISHKEINDETSTPKLQNKKQLYQKKSFSRTLSDVLCRKELEQASLSEKDFGEHDEKGKVEFNKALSLDVMSKRTDSDISGDDLTYSPVGPYVPDSPDMFQSGNNNSKSNTSSSYKSGNRIRTSSEGILSTKSSTSLQDIDENNQGKDFSKTSPIEELNRLSIGNDSTSTVKTSDTVKKDDTRRKSGNSETRSSFGNLSNFTLKRDGLFSRSDNKSPTRPNLATITEDIRRSQSSVGTPPAQTNPDQLQSFNINNNNNKGVDVIKVSNSITPPQKSHRMTSSDASSIDFGDDFGSSLHLSPTANSTPLCIQQLGPIGAEILTGNQKQSIIDMCNRLLDGILVLKHGRTGKPKLRALYCDESLTTLYWREVGRIVDDKGKTVISANGLSQSSVHDAHVTDTEGARFQHLLDQNTIKSMTRRRSSFSVFSKLDSSREVAIRDVLEVTDELTTDVMKRSISKKYVDEFRKPSLVISIILKDRTLDFEIEEVHWGPVFFTLQILVNFYQVRCKYRMSREYSDLSDTNIHLDKKM